MEGGYRGLHRHAHQKRIYATLTLASIAALWWWLDGPNPFQSDESLHMWVEGLGLWGPAAYVSLFAVVGGLAVPGVLFLIPVGLMWPMPVAMALGYAGALGSCLVGFGFARWAGREAVQERLPERLKRHQEQLERHAFMAVLGLRLTLFLFPPANWLMGISSISWGHYVLATALGIIPGIVGFSLLGSELIPLLTSDRRVAVGCAALVLLGWWYTRRRARAHGREFANPNARSSK